MANIEEQILSPGNVKINRLYMVSPNKGRYIDLRDYLAELNIYENLFSPGVSGTITLSDSRNLIKDLPILGEELLLVDFKTPTFDDNLSIYKTFRITGIADKHYAKDGSTQVYILNFCSVETVRDITSAIYQAFEGSPEDIVKRIYTDYLAHARNVRIEDEPPDDTKTPLNIIGKTTNVIKFVSPGWSAVQCINWIAGKSVPENNLAANYLFWETTKGFYFGNLDNLFKNKTSISIGKYIYSQTYVNNSDPGNTAQKMMSIRELSIKKNFDQLSNNNNGYLASRLINVDLYNKKYEVYDYDHAQKFANYTHLETGKVTPLFDLNTARIPDSYKKLNYSHAKLHTDMDNNFDEIIKNISGNRRSNLIELGNFNMSITIPGRTDVEVGNIIQILLPDQKTFEKNNLETAEDDLYSGYYLITALNHKVNALGHFIKMTVTKDCFKASELR